MTIVIDNTVLSNFALIGKIDLLVSALKDFSHATTLQVKEEFMVGIEKGLLTEVDLEWLTILELSAKEENRYQILSQRLGKGEASCLAIALERRYPLATDDRKARTIAQQFGIIVTGTLGILKTLIRKDILSIEETDDILRAMIDQGYFSPIRSLKEIIEKNNG